MEVTTPISRRLFNVSEYHRMGEAGILHDDDRVELIEGEVIEETSKGHRRRPFNVEEYYRMAEVGILHENERVELIQGEIVEMSPIGDRHAACVRETQRLFHQQAGNTAVVSTQNPLLLEDLSEPLPDLAILKAGKYRRHPTPNEVLLIIEVSDTTEAYDREVKVPMYARSAIPEVWVVRLLAHSIRVYRHPENGTYKDVVEYWRGQSISPLMLPEISFFVDEILG